MYGDPSITIRRDRNGYEVCVTDPKIAAANAERDKDGPCDWNDPNVEYNFETKEQAIAFVTSVFDTALPADEYSSAFDKAAKDALDGKS